jgi:predicted transposase/invertase (TIGR01784 family)
VVETLKELSMSPRNREIAEAQEKRRWAQIAREEDRYEEGMTKGLEEGLAEGRLEVRREAARKMKDMGLTPEQIQTALGLSPEEIAQIP